jgi:hypothetical protein
MSIFFQSFRKLSSLELRILLCFLLPPLGIFLLLLTGLYTIRMPKTRAELMKEIKELLSENAMVFKMYGPTEVNKADITSFTYDTVHRGDLRGKKLALGFYFLSAFNNLLNL